MVACRAIRGLLTAFALLSHGGGFAAPGGWFIKVCRVDRPPLELKLSVPSDANNLKNWRSWNPGNPQTIKLPIEYRYNAEVTVWAYGQNKQVEMCLGYNDKSDHIVKHMSFDNSEQKSQKIDDTDSCPC